MKTVIKLLFILLLLVSAVACHKIPSMKQEVVNVLDCSKTLATKENSSEQIPADFFYGNESLYVADQANNRILGIDGNNEPFLEIGELKERESVQPHNLWEKELQSFLSELDESEKIVTQKKKTVSPRKKIRKKYLFTRIDRIISDFNQNIYVVHYNESGMEILKFSPEGNFLYRIGEKGRDNASFHPESNVIQLYISRDNGLWIKYLDHGMLKLQYYNDIGKNIQFFEETQIEPAIQPYLSRKDNEYYQLEDIFPVSELRNLAVIINLYEKKRGKFEVSRKLFFQLNSRYGVENYWEFPEKRIQVFNLNPTQHILGFSYFNKEKTPLLKIYSLEGKKILEKKIMLQHFNYRRVSVFLTQSGDLMGAFLKKNMLYFVLWK